MQKYYAFLSTHIIYLKKFSRAHSPSKKSLLLPLCVPFYCFIEMFGKSNYTEKTTKCNLGQFRKQRAKKFFF